MAIASKNSDPRGVYDGFIACHPDTDGADRTKYEVILACMANPQTVLQRACAVYGNCPHDPVIVPKATVKDTDFNVKMFSANDKKQAVIAEFDIKGNGSFQGITMAYHRDSRPFTLMNTYAVGAISDDGKFHMKVTAYDYTIRDASKHKYEVAGTVSILTPP